MKVGVIQSSYIPWRGYFDFIASVDLFVFYDDVQYSKGDWRNRNRIKTANGTQWLTVPVVHDSLQQRICDTRIDEQKNWRRKHMQSWRSHYGRTPYISDVLGILDTQDAGEHHTLSALNRRLTERICRYLSIITPFAESQAYSLAGKGSERLLSLLTQLGASVYLSGPSADGYLDKAAFREAGIRLEYKTYDYAPYPQRGGPFEAGVTILDLIANLGPASRQYVHSLSPDRLIVS